jgi:hypothetical protein
MNISGLLLCSAREKDSSPSFLGSVAFSMPVAVAMPVALVCLMMPMAMSMATVLPPVPVTVPVTMHMTSILAQHHLLLRHHKLKARACAGRLEHGPNLLLREARVPHPVRLAPSYALVAQPVNHDQHATGAQPLHQPCRRQRWVVDVVQRHADARDIEVAELGPRERRRRPGVEEVAHMSPAGLRRVALGLNPRVIDVHHALRQVQPDALAHRTAQRLSLPPHEQNKHACMHTSPDSPLTLVKSPVPQA